MNATTHTRRTPLNFEVPLSADKVDTVNGVIRRVSVMTAGIALGHDLEVDGKTLDQLVTCANAKGGQIAARIDHRSGAASIVGYLSNFTREPRKVTADFFLLDTHPQRNQMLETAERMPRGVGLSASFLPPDNAEPGKARIAELVSVDWVSSPAANPSGLFSRPEPERPLTGVEKVHRVIGAAGKGAEVGALGGVAARLLLKRRGLTADGAATTGAALGALAAGAYQWRRDSQPDARRDFAARVAAICFTQRAAVGRLLDATRDNVNVPIPGEEQARTVATLAKKPLARRVAIRAAKIGAGAGLGYLAGRKVGAKAGAITGAVAGALFSNADVRRTVSLSIAQANRFSKI